MIVRSEFRDLDTPTGPMRTHVYTPVHPTTARKYPGLLLYSEIFQQTAPDRAAVRPARQPWLRRDVARDLSRARAAGYRARLRRRRQGQGEPLQARDEAVRLRRRRQGGPDRAARASRVQRADRDGGILHRRPSRRSAPPCCRTSWPAPASSRPTSTRGTLGEGKNADTLARIGEIKGELVMIWGRQDPHIPGEGRRRSTEALDGGRRPLQLARVQRGARLHARRRRALRRRGRTTGPRPGPRPLRPHVVTPRGPSRSSFSRGRETPSRPFPRQEDWEDLMARLLKLVAWCAVFFAAGPALAQSTVPVTLVHHFGGFTGTGLGPRPRWSRLRTARSMAPRPEATARSSAWSRRRTRPCRARSRRCTRSPRRAGPAPCPRPVSSGPRDGSYYGTTSRGGANGAGTVYRMVVETGPPRAHGHGHGRPHVRPMGRVGRKRRAVPGRRRVLLRDDEPGGRVRLRDGVPPGGHGRSLHRRRDLNAHDPPRVRRDRRQVSPWRADQGRQRPLLRDDGRGRGSLGRARSTRSRPASTAPGTSSGSSRRSRTSIPASAPIRSGGCSRTPTAPSTERRAAAG